MPLPSSLPPESSTAPLAPPGFLSWVARLVHAHRARLLSYARRRGLDPEESLDAVQDSFAAFLRLPDARSMAKDGDDALRLLTVVLRHNVLNRRRTHRRHPPQPVDALVERVDQNAEDSEVLLARAEELARVHGCIRQMARLQREVVRLSLLDGEPREEAARTLGISPGHLRVLLHRARAHLRSCSFEEPEALQPTGRRDVA